MLASIWFNPVLAWVWKSKEMQTQHTCVWSTLVFVGHCPQATASYVMALYALFFDMLQCGDELPRGHAVVSLSVLSRSMPRHKTKQFNDDTFLSCEFWPKWKCYSTTERWSRTPKSLPSPVLGGNKNWSRALVNACLMVWRVIWSRMKDILFSDKHCRSQFDLFCLSPASAFEMQASARTFCLSFLFDVDATVAWSFHSRWLPNVPQRAFGTLHGWQGLAVLFPHHPLGDRWICVSNEQMFPLTKCKCPIPPFLFVGSSKIRQLPLLCFPTCLVACVTRNF